MGDRVTFLNETGEGVVTYIIGPGMVRVQVEEGLELPMSVGDLIKVREDIVEDLLNETASIPHGVKSEPEPKRVPTRRERTTYEIDLHLEELVDSTRGLQPGEMLELQLERFREFLREAMDNRWNKIVVIHGVGEGVLRSNIHAILDEMPHVSYHDASYRKYGRGATEVMIRYK
ncbi:MAG: Smr/MutS family protein [Flavobacteriales bacterium]|nr:Smr/MutS family protein [Flavobacteriales bacterium]